MEPPTTTKERQRVIVAGAGPAGLSAAAELVAAGPDKYAVTVLEKDPEYVGGIARTVSYRGYRFDIGGHRFFSKSAEITAWWQRRLGPEFIGVRRLSRIFYRGKFFDYPLKPLNALRGLGVWTSALCMASYVKSRLHPIKPEKSFADWITNRFGEKLFRIFFKTYTEKVWGLPCEGISADWAAQRIKGLSLLTAIRNALFPQPTRAGTAVVKTLIDQFQYPKFGPGQMWEKTRDDIVAAGGEVVMGEEVVAIETAADRAVAIVTRNAAGAETRWPGDHFIISIPLRETAMAIRPPLPATARGAAGRLRYRDFLTVALMVRRPDLFPDNWIYVHDPNVRLGRIQNFNNWSPHLVPDPNTTCLGLEYFCFEGDDLWTAPDSDLIALGRRELAQLGLVPAADVTDGCVVRMPKAYPVYGPGYLDDVAAIRGALARFGNLQVVGRNGMHKYNNQDHSMMTALLAARNIGGAAFDLWKVNTDAEYHEETAADAPDPTGRQQPATTATTAAARRL